MISSCATTFSHGSAALDAAVTPDYRLNTVYSVGPERALTDMVLEAGAAETEDVITAEEDVTAYEWGKLAVSKGVLSATDFEEALSYGTEGDTLSLAEHHIYGSSRLGVQRYDSLGLANITHLPEAEVTHVRTTLNNRDPWYSYAYADLIDSTKRVEYDATVNTYTGTLYNSRNLGRRYYELTDHLGNVLATVLDRKTGSKASPEATLYDHWSADLASVVDYYPGGMMMPGRNLEHDWSRMGAQGSPKDDEVYGKGNFIDMGDRPLDTRILRIPRPDAKASKYPSESPYSYAGNSPIIFIDPDGKEKIIVIGGGDATGADKNKFVNSGLLQLNNYFDKSTENITLVVTDIFVSEQVKYALNQLPNADKRINVIYVSNGQQITNYINSKSPNADFLSKQRVEDPVTEMSMFGHGYMPEYSSQGPEMGGLEPAHGYVSSSLNEEEMTSPIQSRPMHNQFAWGKNDIDKLSPRAFSKMATIEYFMCNSATPGSQGQSLVTYTSSKLGVTAIGYEGRTNYKDIYNGSPLGMALKRYLGRGVGPAQNLPSQNGGHQYDEQKTPTKKVVSTP